MELSRLHWLSVIARGSSFKFRGIDADLTEIGSVLDVNYVLTGTLSRQANGYSIAVELSRLPDSEVVWVQRFVVDSEEFLSFQSVLAAQIAATIEPRIQHAEAMGHRHLGTESLDARSAFHLGLWHMYRFTASDNARAQQFFTRALALDGRFSRAMAGLSFTHFQNAFLRFESDHQAQMATAYRYAEACVEMDPLDPFANLSMGRAEWLSGHLDSALPWMERSVSLSPNYAFAIYNSSLVGTLLGEAEQNEKSNIRAIELSPIDPLHYAMLATRAWTYVLREDYGRAGQWAERAVRSPNAHVQIYVIAAFAAELSGNLEQARRHIERVRKFNPKFSREDFFSAFPIQPIGIRQATDAALDRLSL